MTDNEIIKALECCANGRATPKCKYCPYCGTDWCVDRLKKDALDLIKSQQEENNLLKIDNELMTTKVFEMAMNKAVADKVRAEAIKEFEKEIRKRKTSVCGIPVYLIEPIILDMLVDEMIGGADNG